MITNMHTADAVMITEHSQKTKTPLFWHICWITISIRELAEIAKHLREQGKDDAAAQIEKGVEDFEKGNMRLSIALSLVQ